MRRPQSQGQDRFAGAVPSRVRASMFVLCLFVVAGWVTPLAAGPLRNVILLIGDGMGPEQVAAARMYNGAPLSFESAPYQTTMTTHSASNPVTDSAASATAIATGQKVNNGVVSLAIPGGGNPLKTALGVAKDHGKRTGLVTTAEIWDPTPAAFGAHVSHRTNIVGIIGDYLLRSRPNVLFGGGRAVMELFPVESFFLYDVVTDRAELESLDKTSVTHVSGQFAPLEMPFELHGVGDAPHLSEMTAAAIEILSQDPDGFFLMAEGARIDHAGHANWRDEMVYEVLEFANAVQVALDFAAGRDDTLIIVTADHETGGLSVLADNGPGVMPAVSWSTHGHTDVPVPVYAFGLGAELILDVTDNTDLFPILTMSSFEGTVIPEPSSVVLAAVAVLGIATLRLRRYRRSGARWQI